MAKAEMIRAIGVILGVVVGLIVGFWAFGWVDGYLGGTGFLEQLAVFLIALAIGVLAGYLTYKLIQLIVGHVVAAIQK